MIEQQQHYRIGFPLSRPSSDFKHAAIICQPCESAGFHEIVFKEERFRLPEHNLGSPILNPVKKQGCYGQLILAGDEERDVIDRKANEVVVQGRSMQCALALAVFSQSTYDHDHMPLVLVSAAVQYPLGAPPYLGASIAPYCRYEESLQSIMDKYQCALRLNASALLLGEQDVKALKQKAKETGISLRLGKLSDLDGRLSEETPWVIELKPMDLPKLAAQLGVNPLHYRSESKVKVKNKKKGLLIALILTFCLCIGGLLIYGIEQYLRKKEMDEIMQQRRGLISEIYSEKYHGSKSRVRDEAVKAFIHLERKVLAEKIEHGMDVDDGRIDLKEIELSYADLHSQDLGLINFLAANFSHGNFNRANFQGSYLKGASFESAHLYASDLQYAVLSRADFRKANLRKANFKQSVGLETADLRGALYDNETEWPESFSTSKLKAKGLIYSPSTEEPVFINPMPDDKKPSSRSRGRNIGRGSSSSIY